ncbi:MAG: ACT domain-containing protein [Planctomycetaceae bacterium]
MQVTITAVGPDNCGLADPIVHYVASAGANIHEIQMFDHDRDKIFAMMLRIEWPDDAGTVAKLRLLMNEIGKLKGLSNEPGREMNMLVHLESQSVRLIALNQSSLY